MPGRSDDDLSPRVRAAMANLTRDAAAAEVVRALAVASIPSVILKGAALFDWYPEDAVRTYVDADVWIPPHAQVRASKILTKLGFEHDAQALDPAALPDWWAEHATTWVRGVDGGKIDLHRHLQGVGCAPKEAWALLWPQTETFKLAGQEARRLHVPARALYVTLHAAGHGAGYSGSQIHLHAALRTVDRSGWEAAAGLADRLDAVEMFSAGLRLLPAGAVLADQLGLPAVSSVETVLHTLTPPPVALGFEQLASVRGRQRLGVLVRKFLPPPAFIRHWWPPAARNGLLLAVGYLYRPIWILRRAPAGWRVWRAARRQVADQERDASSSR